MYTQKMDEINRSIGSLNKDQKNWVLRAMFGLVDDNTPAEEIELANLVIATLKELGLRWLPETLFNCNL